MNPLVNSLIDKEHLSGSEPVYPLKVERCQNCALVQITKPISGHEIYQGQDYLYFTGDMPTTSAYFKEFADDVMNRFAPRFVVEIGSNDGTFLKHIPVRKLGVDPSTNVIIRALRDGIPTLSDFFTERNAKNISKEWGKANFIMGANCIAHLEDLEDMMNGVVALLDLDGVFSVECNYWGAMVENTNYSLIYHDHFSYFSLKNWSEFVRRFGMRVFDAEVTPAQGGSLRLFACFEPAYHEQTVRFDELLKKEIETKLEKKITGTRYREAVASEADKLHKLVEALKADGKTIAGYGAAAKGFSVLKMANITEKHIDYFVDDSPAKQGKYTPVTHIPVISRAEAEAKLPDYFFITAPNYEAVIVEKERSKGFMGKFITCDSRIIE